jgi:hypothetical protein
MFVRFLMPALGVELNFPEGHSLTTVSPVDFRVSQSPESASVWVGAADQVTGMRWSTSRAGRAPQRNPRTSAPVR